MDDAQAEQLVSKAALVASDPTDVRERYQAALSSYAASQHQLDKRYLDLAPTFLDLHKQASSSADLLDSLQAFLSTFQSDLSTLSSHISSLQNTSHAIDARLDARRQVETDLASFLSEITISPRIVDLFFDTEPDNRLELWHKAVRTLERVIDATNKLNKLPTQSASTSPDSQALTEARNLADTCKNVVAAKLRNYLLSPYAAIKSSVTTNLQVLQTSILLKHHRPFYAFLARQMPRVAIDVQRNYVAAARLYFETAFRRYARSLGTIKARWTESPFPLITDAPGTSSKSLGAGAAAMGKFSPNASHPSYPRYPDPPLTCSHHSLSVPYRVDAAGHKCGARPQLVLRSMASGQLPSRARTSRWAQYRARLPVRRRRFRKSMLSLPLTKPSTDTRPKRAPPEALFRSIALVLVDNACSEYAFLLRFFELPASSDETASSVVALTADEMAHRGASDEIFRQIFEPAISNFTVRISPLVFDQIEHELTRVLDWCRHLSRRCCRRRRGHWLWCLF